MKKPWPREIVALFGWPDDWAVEHEGTRISVMKKTDTVHIPLLAGFEFGSKAFVRTKYVDEEGYPVFVGRASHTERETH